MARHVVAFLVKFGATAAALYVIALFWPLLGSMTFLHAVVLGLVIAVLGYVSDLIIPRAVNNIVAVMLDFILAAAVVWLGSIFLPGMAATDSFIIICALLIAGVEMFYHAKFVRT